MTFYLNDRHHLDLTSEVEAAFNRITMNARRA
jgi:hypothetical protein